MSIVFVKGKPVQMSQDELASLDLPGRNIFGPMNQQERERVLSRSLQCLEWIKRNNYEDLYERLSKFMDSVADQSFKAGVGPASSTVKTFVKETLERMKST